jgi:3-hydroxyisobutyrate dehydrogenase-like beta-hydroxyacid dehydrogenase
MGRPMAGHLLAKGHEVTVWNRTPGRADELRKSGALVAKTPQDVSANCEIVFICVSRTEDVEQVTGKLAETASERSLFVDHSTIEPAGARRIGEGLSAKGIGFVDAPLTGGEKGALAGALTIFCGGTTENFERARPLMTAYGKNVRLVGALGQGQMMKMANQVSVALCVLAMSECLVFAECAGLSMEESIELIGSGAGGSWSLTNYGPKVLDRDWSPGFAVELQQKDLLYALASAREIGVSLPGTALVHQLFSVLENQGRGGNATPALFEVIEALSSRQAND